MTEYGDYPTENVTVRLPNKIHQARLYSIGAESEDLKIYDGEDGGSEFDVAESADLLRHRDGVKPVGQGSGLPVPDTNTDPDRRAKQYTMRKTLGGRNRLCSGSRPVI